eukprot:GCRY01000229.1.p1 GENE.GCRY01000229.1~~GCRY01000229.1.p1  ORF type:complete len:319 (+),score=41.51 GCRY01000229.1:137-958(+)
MLEWDNILLLSKVLDKIENFSFHSYYFSQPHVPVVGAILYLVTVFSLKKFMENRKPFELKWASTIHNFNLFVISIVTVFGSLYQANQLLEKNAFSLSHVFCEEKSVGNPVQGAMGFWCFVFYLTKYYELVDTVLLALRKKPLLKLHLYHHAIMLVCTWFFLHDQHLSIAWSCTVVNSIIHSFMYFYYLRASLGLKTWWKKYLTTLQIIQFSFGFCLTLSWIFKNFAEGCNGGFKSALVAHHINLTFLYLFVDFFRYTYVTKPKPASDKVKKIQ